MAGFLDKAMALANIEKDEIQLQKERLREKREREEQRRERERELRDEGSSPTMKSKPESPLQYRDVNFEDREDVHAKLDLAIKEAEKWHHRFTQVEAESERYGKQNNNYQAQLKALKEKLEATEVRARELETERVVMTQKLRTAEVCLQHRDAALRKQQESMQEGGELEVTAKLLSEVESKLQVAEAELITTRDHALRKNNESMESRTKLIEVTENLSSAQLRIEQLEHEVENDSKRSQLQEEVKVLTMRLSRKEDEIKELERSNYRHQADIVAKLEREKIALERSLRAEIQDCRGQLKIANESTMRNVPRSVVVIIASVLVLIALFSVLGRRTSKAKGVLCGVQQSGVSIAIDPRDNPVGTRPNKDIVKLRKRGARGENLKDAPEEEEPLGNSRKG